MHALLDSVIGRPRDRQQLDAIAQLVREHDVLGRDMADAFDINAVEIDLVAEGDAGQNRELVRRVDTVHVEAWIGFGVAEPLRFDQHIIEFTPAIAHRAQDVVAGPVEDAVKRGDGIRRQPLAHRLDDRDAAGHRRLVAERHAGVFRQPGEGRAVQRDQRLVGGHHVAPGTDGRLANLARHAAVAADQLHHHLRIRLPGHGGGIVEPLGRVQRRIALAATLARRDRGDLDGMAAAARQLATIFGEEPQHPGPDRPETGNGNFQ